MKSILSILTLVLISCATSQDTAIGNNHSTTQDHESKNLAKIRFLDYLRNQPGVQITRLGNQYEVLIRGHKSFQGDNNPLYVLDGVIIGRSFRDAESAVDVTQIKDVSIIPPPRAGKYGSRGQNGVIEITTKTVK